MTIKCGLEDDFYYVGLTNPIPTAWGSNNFYEETDPVVINKMKYWIFHPATGSINDNIFYS